MPSFETFFFIGFPDFFCKVKIHVEDVFYYLTEDTEILFILSVYVNATFQVFIYHIYYLLREFIWNSKVLPVQLV